MLQPGLTQKKASDKEAQRFTQLEATELPFLWSRTP